jgi:ribosomal protein S30
VLPACERPRYEPRGRWAAQYTMRVSARASRRPLWRSHSP